MVTGIAATGVNHQLEVFRSCRQRSLDEDCRIGIAKHGAFCYQLLIRIYKELNGGRRGGIVVGGMLRTNIGGVVRPKISVINRDIMDITMYTSTDLVIRLLMSTLTVTIECRSTTTTKITSTTTTESNTGNSKDVLTNVEHTLLICAILDARMYTCI